GTRYGRLQGLYASAVLKRPCGCCGLCRPGGKKVPRSVARRFDLSQKAYCRTRVAFRQRELLLSNSKPAPSLAPGDDGRRSPRAFSSLSGSQRHNVDVHNGSAAPVCEVGAAQGLVGVVVSAPEN